MIDKTLRPIGAFAQQDREVRLAISLYLLSSNERALRENPRYAVLAISAGLPERFYEDLAALGAAELAAPHPMLGYRLTQAGRATLERLLQKHELPEN